MVGLNLVEDFYSLIIFLISLCFVCTEDISDEILFEFE